MSGSLFSLPSGNVKLALGGEYRDENFTFNTGHWRKWQRLFGEVGLCRAARTNRWSGLR